MIPGSAVVLAAATVGLGVDTAVDMATGTRLTVAVPVDRPPSRLPVYVLYGAIGAVDLWSTERALRQPHVYETNPLGQSKASRVALAVGGAVLRAELDRALAKKPLARWTARIALVGVGALVIRQNIRNGN